ncbi:MAG: peptide ABC transporter substrate-binding protein, partial [Gammaproteobacteria bacterium]
MLSNSNAMVYLLFTLLVLTSVAGCDGQSWNSPYPLEQAEQGILYSSFSKRPNHLDPVQSYSSNEVVFTGQIYEPPLQYHYLKRPYELAPLTAVEIPQPYFLDADRNPLPNGVADQKIAYSVYDIQIKPGILYQPHPAFAKKPNGQPAYRPLSREQLSLSKTISDFTQTGSRELKAKDYVYQIKRLAHPDLHSPIYGIMTEYILGLEGYSTTLKQAKEEHLSGSGAAGFLNLEDYAL